jgi:DNA sulfur modification protein DndB
MGSETATFTYTFPAIRGVQAGKEYYVSMWPLGLAVKLLKVSDEEMPPEITAQRTLNKSRIPEISRYILENRGSYGFSSLTVSIDRQVQFLPHGEDGISNSMGSIQIPMETRFLINDGQHRRAAIEKALDQCPELASETISIVIFVDEGLVRSQQLFADLNRYAVRPTRSLNILYDHRHPMSRLAKSVAERVVVFKGMTEKAKTTISNRSRKLFTLSSIYQATSRLLQKGKEEGVLKREEDLAVDFWNEVAGHIPEWKLAKEGHIPSHELRSDFIHAHGIALQCLANCGVEILKYPKSEWKKRLAGLQKVDWQRSNSKIWEGRALVGGRVSKSANNVVLASNVLKTALGIPLNASEEKVETLYQQGKT